MPMNGEIPVPPATMTIGRRPSVGRRKCGGRTILTDTRRGCGDAASSAREMKAEPVPVRAPAGDTPVGLVS